MIADFFDSENEICGLCARHCHIPDGVRGFCRVRENVRGELIAKTYGKITAAAFDPVEKKPLYHFLPGTETFSLSSFGCNFTCKHCQNYELSQSDSAPRAPRIEPDEAVFAAIDNGAQSISFTYNEPTVSFEFVYDVCKSAHQHNIRTALITNGYMEAAPLEKIAPYLDAVRIDLKAFSDEFYESVCGGAHLEPVLNTAVRAKRLGLHVELVTLLIPGLNDSEEEIAAMLDWELKTLGPAVPHHFTAFTPMYKMTDRARTPFSTVDSAFRAAKEAGLYYPYVGNLSHAEGSKTYCPDCGELLAIRAGYVCRTPGLAEGGVCRKCGRKIEGIFL
jgi:Pyruvate-formate lyase-activating enzyme